ncbi:MAG: YciI family protein [Acidimicrobiales bacterium]
MEYMILIHTDEHAERPGPGMPGFDEMMAGWMAYNQRLIDGGHWIAGASLQPTATATTVHRSGDAAPAVTDGPFVETKEQLGGFYMVSADDLDQAIELASAIPLPFASFEIRPVAFRPDAG